MSARSKARKRALDVLYSADVRGQDAQDALDAEETRARTEPSREGSWAYAREIVAGVITNAEEIDELIETYSQGWPLTRMPAVDRAILRIGVWEILHNDAVPDGVAISEAVESAQALSTDDSPGFVNGLLARISHTKPAAP